MKLIHVLTLLSLVTFSLPGLLPAAGKEWQLQESTLTYHVSHPLHESEGVSHAAKGKGICTADLCSFLVAVPVKSFDSGDSNRDLHMLQVVRGATYPLVTVRTKVPINAAGQPSIRLDLDVEFSGQTAHYAQVPFQVTNQGGTVRIVGTIPAKLSDFKIDPPSLLAISVKNDIPIKVETVWR